MESIRKQLEMILLKNNLLESNDEVHHITEEIDVENLPQDEENIGISSDGTRYYKKLVFQYLTENGYRINQDYIDLAAKKFQVNDAAGKVTKERTEVVKHTEIDEIPEEQLPLFMQMKNLEMLSSLMDMLSEQRKMMMQDQMKEYDIDVIRDLRGGSTDVSALKKSLEWHQERGYTLKQMVTNELGKNAMSISMGNYTSGVNSTQDQMQGLRMKSK